MRQQILKATLLGMLSVARFTAFLLTLAILVLACGCSSLWKPDGEIRSALLNKTPVGSTRQDVWEHLERRGWNPKAEKPELKVFLKPRTDWMSRPEIDGRSYWLKRNGDLVRVNPEEFTIGVSWIQGHLGRYWHRAGRRGIPCYYVVDASWCFDGDNRLVEILVYKEPEM